MQEVMPRIFKQQNRIVKESPPAVATMRPGSASASTGPARGKTVYYGSPQRSGLPGQTPMGSSHLFSPNVASALQWPRAGSERAGAGPSASSNPAPKGTPIGASGELQTSGSEGDPGVASVILGNIPAHLNSIRPPPRARGGSDADTSQPGNMPAVSYGTAVASTSRPSSDASSNTSGPAASQGGTARPASKGSGSALLGPANGGVSGGVSNAGTMANSTSPVEAAVDDAAESRIRQRMQKALRDESLQQLKQKLLHEHESRMQMGSVVQGRQGIPPDRSMTMEGRQRDTKSRARVRPLLPPRAPSSSWSPGFITNVVHRPALSIEARSVPLPTTRPRTGHGIASLVASEPAASHGGAPSLTTTAASRAPGSGITPGANSMGAVSSERSGAASAKAFLRRQTSH